MTDKDTQIKPFFIRAVLYLPLCFFLWFFFSSLLVMPVKWLLDLALTTWQPDLFNGVSQIKYILNIETLIFPSDMNYSQQQKIAVLDVTVNPMIYGYGFAVVAGLVLSMTNLSAKTKAKQVFLTYLVVVCVQVFGCFWEGIKHLTFNAGIDAQTAILATGVNNNVVALLYQLSYLIFPAVIPIILWVLMNNNFIRSITDYDIKSYRNFNS